MKYYYIFLFRHFHYFFPEDIERGYGVHEKELFQNSIFNSCENFPLVISFSAERPEAISAFTLYLPGSMCNAINETSYKQKCLKDIGGRLLRYRI
jgi:hypothetical protein